MNHKIIAQILPLMIICLLLVCRISECQEGKHDTILIEQNETTKSWVKRMLDRTKTMTADALAAWINALSNATDESIGADTILLNLGNAAFDLWFNEDDVFQEELSQRYLQRLLGFQPNHFKNGIWLYNL